MEQMSVRLALVLLAAVFLASTSTMVVVSARYLPTRSQEDRLERLRELLKDLFDSDYDHKAYPMPDVPMVAERAPIYKRSAGPQYSVGTNGHDLIKGMMSRNGPPASIVSTLGGSSGMIQIPASMFESTFADPERKVMK